jgi:uncharacterized surface protein with fasciclin (FAS1) repeats
MMIFAKLIVIPLLASAQQSTLKGNIVETLEKDGRFTQLRKMLKTTGIETFLSASGPYTIFAPVDKAFFKLPVNVRKAIVETDANGSQLVSGFVLRGKYGMVSFTNGTSARGKPLTHQMKSFADTFLTTISRNGKLEVNGASIIGEIITSNGTILIIDKVIPVIISAPAKTGPSRALPQNLLKWGLGKYVLPAQRSIGFESLVPLNLGHDPADDLVSQF